ncbi:MAG: AAA family ATPase [Planctomycetes bacterium]|nr:AAA family ATPase [Planctomycetota bacterium]
MGAREEAERAAREFGEAWAALEGALRGTVVGHAEAVEQVLTAFFAGGHVLLEGVPGLGKTLLVRTLAGSVGLSCSRIQCTPDLMPADVTGTNVVAEEGGRRTFVFRKGPVFTNVLLADEVNRATPKTQSALLEAMEEKAVTAAGESHRIDPPFHVLATQNPLEMEGTFPLPEAQLDRFLFKVLMAAPSGEELLRIVDRTTGAPAPAPARVLEGARVVELQRLVREVVLEGPARALVARLVGASSPDGEGAPPSVKRFVRYGASPRGAQALALGAKVRALAAGRVHAAAADVIAVARPALRHRLLLNFEGEAEGASVEGILGEILEAAG